MGAKKYIFVTGGVLSGVGKGITAASIGALLQAKGASVSIQKCDPYLNVDAGRLDPKEHGECFVTRDGAETDLDLGHYERFLDIELSRKSTTLSGRLLLDLIEKERSGGFAGKTVQLVPHLTNAIQAKIRQAGDGSDVHIVEIGGTVGDYESLSFIEAIREFAWKAGRENCLFVHVVYIPFIETSKEFKTKPAQNALNDLRGFGITPDAVIARSDSPAPQSVARKLALFGGVPESQVQLMPNVDTVFRIPLIIAKNGVHELLSNFTGLSKEPVLTKWQQVIDNQAAAKKGQRVVIGLVTDQVDNDDTHLSLLEALRAASHQQQVNLELRVLDARTASEEDFQAVDGLVVPGGFGDTGFEAKVATASYALEHKLPYLGIGLGLQVAVIAAARRGGLRGATSEEVSTDGVPVIHRADPGGKRFVGESLIRLQPGSLIQQAYGKNEVKERHRHQYVVNPDYHQVITEAGIVVSGVSGKPEQVEMIEARSHPFFAATQAHIEYTSRPFRAHKLIERFMQTARQRVDG